MNSAYTRGFDIVLRRIQRHEGRHLHKPNLEVALNTNYCRNHGGRNPNFGRMRGLSRGKL